MAETLTQEIRDARAVEFFLYYDSVVIGPNADRTDRGWFNSFADLANADRIGFFGGRAPNVGKSYTNTNFERRDLAYGIDHMALEFIVPTTAREYVEQGCEAHVIPSLFTEELPNQLALKLEIQGLDTLLELPARRMPAGAGSAQKLADQLGIGAFYPGANGEVIVSNMMHFPETLMVPAANQISLEGKVDAPLRALLANYTTTPGNNILPGHPAGTFYTMPRFYVMRVVAFCRRRAQLRGARSAP